MSALLALVAAVPGQTQVPREYPSSNLAWTRTDQDKSAQIQTREEAKAAQAAAACDAGDLAGCAALGRAYRDGEGRPQNRLVAELFFRQACDGAEAAECFALGEQLRRFDNAEAKDEGMIAL